MNPKEPTMATVASDLQSINKKVEDTHGRLVELQKNTTESIKGIETKVDLSLYRISEIKESNEQIKMTVYGKRDRETGTIIAEGISSKVERHESMFGDYVFLKRLTNLMYGVITLVGIDALIQVFNVLKTLKVFAGHP